MRDNKLIGGDQSGIEQSLTVAIRRASGSGNESELMSLAEQVRQLLETAKKGKDRALTDCVGRLLAELRSAAGTGPKVRKPILEYKDCALSLSSTTDRFEVRRANRAAMEFGGYGSTFGGPPDSYGDIIEPGAYRKTLQRHRDAGTLPKLFWSHDPRQVAGKWVDMHEDSRGLVAEGRLAKTTLGNDLNELLGMGAVDALSIGFVIPEGGARHNRDGVRIISEIDLHEVSLVSLPANPRARLTLSQPEDPADKLSSLLRAAAAAAAAEEKPSNVIRFPAGHGDAEIAESLKALADNIRNATKVKR